MIALGGEPSVRCFLLKVASRCNINCDYCYMYKHLDQSWVSQPKFMNDDLLKLSAQRIADYTIEKKFDRISIVYHGGEPLLLGAQKIVDHAEIVKKFLPNVEVEFSLQTNGTLLTREDLVLFRKAKIQVSLSLDGPAYAHDRHRLGHDGKSTYKATEQALALLEEFQDVFSGVIAVIDHRNNPQDLLEFFASKNIPQLDFLLPDANYLTLPPGKNESPNIYKEWLLECFDTWFDKYPHLKIRTFDTILSSLLGAPSETDGLGFGDVSLITIETDGTYQDLDVLKITGSDIHLKGNIQNTSIKDALKSDHITLHRENLQKDGLCVTCQECPVVHVCGGGSVAHRYSKEGYKNPSVYCEELKALIEHANQRVMGELKDEIAKTNYKSPEISTDNIFIFETQTGKSTALIQVLSEFKDSQSEAFKNALESLRDKSDSYTAIMHLPFEVFRNLSIQPSVVVWTEVQQKTQQGLLVHNIDGEVINNDDLYLDEIYSLASSGKWPAIHREDSWLRKPFGKKIFFEDQNSLQTGTEVFETALSLISNWNPEIIEEMKLISPEIQFIRDLSAHPDKVVSFSDNSVPGALYVQLKRGIDFIDPADLADSIIHEHRHQKLYLLQRVCPIVNADFPLVKSPWREELRPPTGLFHALYVFTELLSFWSHLALSSDTKLKQKAKEECRRISEQLSSGFGIVESCDLTDEGLYLLKILNEKYFSLHHEYQPALKQVSS